jgi:hypothetical protein
VVVAAGGGGVAGAGDGDGAASGGGSRVSSAIVATREGEAWGRGEIWECGGNGEEKAEAE